jgi:hypothetical protein
LRVALCSARSEYSVSSQVGMPNTAESQGVGLVNDVIEG